MTTIAWDGKAMAADRQAATGNTPHVSHGGKIKRITFNGVDALIGRCGTIASAMQVVDWLAAGANPANKPEISSAEDDSFSLLLATAKGVYYFATGTIPVFIGRRPWAIGSGGDYALGAMEAGADARKAVQIACKLDINSGMGIDVLTLAK